MDGIMREDQRALAFVCRDGDLVPAKAVAYRTGLAVGYLYQLMSGHRTVPPYVFNAVMHVALEKYGPFHPSFWAVTQQVLPLFMRGIPLCISPFSPPASDVDVPKLCEEIGVLFSDVGAFVQSFGEICADGQIDDADQVHADELNAKAPILIGRINDLVSVVNAKVTAAASGSDLP